MRTAHTPLFPLLTLLLSAAGCSSESPATALILVTDVDPTLPVDEVTFSITPPEGGEPQSSGGSEFPAFVTLEHRSGAPLKGYEVVVEGLRDGEDEEVASLTAEVEFTKRQTLVVELHLTTDCENGCPQGTLDDDDYGPFWGSDGMPPSLDTSMDGGMDAGGNDGGNDGDGGMEGGTDEGGTDEGGTDDAGAGLLCVGEEVCDDAGGCMFEPDPDQDGDSCGPEVTCADGVCGGEDVCTDGTCNPECGDDVASCRLDCGAVANCAPTCDGTMSCTMDCSQSGCNAHCRNGAKCVLLCHRPNCDFETCTNAQGNNAPRDSCSNDVKTCNGAPCP